MLGNTQYPHIIDAILAITSHSGLLALRGVSLALRTKVDRVLFRHVVIHLIPAPGTIEVLDPAGHRLPVPTCILQQSSCRIKIQEAAKILCQAKTIDISVRYHREFNYWVGWRVKVFQAPNLTAMDLWHPPNNTPWNIRLLTSWAGVTTVSTHQTFKFSQVDLGAFLTTVAANSGHTSVPNSGLDETLDGDKPRPDPAIFWTYPPGTLPRRCVLNVAFHPSNEQLVPAAFFVAWPPPCVGREYVVHFRLDASLPHTSRTFGPTTPHSARILYRLLDGVQGTSYIFVGAEKLPSHPFGAGGHLGVLRDVPMSFLTQDEYRRLVGDERFAMETVIPRSPA